MDSLHNKAEQEPVAEAYALADKVRTELDKKCCPVAYMNVAWEAVVTNYRDLIHTTPPQRKPLTDEEIYSLADSLEIWNEDDEEWILDPNTFARAIEAKLKELNT